MQCCLTPGKSNSRRRPLSELYVNGNFTEDREEWQRELQKRFEEVYTDQEETREVQENIIEDFKKRGDQQFSMEGRNAEHSGPSVAGKGQDERHQSQQT